jgi:hypothetical protein
VTLIWDYLDEIFRVFAVVNAVSPFVFLVLCVVWPPRLRDQFCVSYSAVYIIYVLCYVQEISELGEAELMALKEKTEESLRLRRDAARGTAARTDGRWRFWNPNIQ